MVTFPNWSSAKPCHQEQLKPFSVFPRLVTGVTVSLSLHLLKPGTWGSSFSPFVLSTFVPHIQAPGKFGLSYFKNMFCFHSLLSILKATPKCTPLTILSLPDCPSSLLTGLLSVCPTPIKWDVLLSACKINS